VNLEKKFSKTIENREMLKYNLVLNKEKKQIQRAVLNYWMVFFFKSLFYLSLILCIELFA